MLLSLIPHLLFWFLGLLLLTTIFVWGYLLRLKFFLFQEARRLLFLLITIKGVVPIIFMLIILKIGLPPLHFWLIPILKKIRWKRIIILLSLIKILPILLLIFLVQPTPLLFFCLLFTTIALPILISLRKMIFFSRRVTSFWIILIRRFTLILRGGYIVIYMVIIYTLLKRENRSPILFFLLIGLPPVFFLKWLFLASLQNMINYVLIGLFLVNIVLYLRAITAFFSLYYQPPIQVNWGWIIVSLFILGCSF